MMRGEDIATFSRLTLFMMWRRFTIDFEYTSFCVESHLVVGWDDLPCEFEVVVDRKLGISE